VWKRVVDKWGKGRDLLWERGVEKWEEDLGAI
jgi:hypothetical protein